MPYPFRWIPAAGERHATTDSAPGPGLPPAGSAATLCDRQVVVAHGEQAWLWPTCRACGAAVHPLAAAHNARHPAPKAHLHGF
ncbi:zinc finger protein [Saccharopolyspora sp. MS10]|uniref:zinc finger protein n=1 Tax=Saccharopolyspora sp. MS10 TaxID=3385973 RepID=UPI0039A097ED